MYRYPSWLLYSVLWFIFSTVLQSFLGHFLEINSCIVTKISFRLQGYFWTKEMIYKSVRLSGFFSTRNLENIDIYIVAKCKGKGAGLKPNIRFDNLSQSADFTFYPLVTEPVDFACHFNSTESIQSCSHFGALNLWYTLPSLSYQVIIFT